jgi:hypothetical protein
MAEFDGFSKDLVKLLNLIGVKHDHAKCFDSAGR